MKQWKDQSLLKLDLSDATFYLDSFLLEVSDQPCPTQLQKNKTALHGQSGSQQTSFMNDGLSSKSVKTPSM